MSEYISIKEFAKRSAITTQAVYQRLNKDLKKYLKVIDGKKMIDTMALNNFIHKDSKDIVAKCNEEIDKANEQVDNQVANQFKEILKENVANLQSEQKVLQSAIEVFIKQLEEKDKQIKSLQEELNIQNEHVRKQSDRLVGLVEQVNELQRNNQVLLAQKDMAKKELETKKQKKGIFSWMSKKQSNDEDN